MNPLMMSEKYPPDLFKKRREEYLKKVESLSAAARLGELWANGCRRWVLLFILILLFSLIYTLGRLWGWW